MDDWPKMEPLNLDYSFEDLDDIYHNYEGSYRGYEQSVTLHAQMENGVGGGSSGSTDEPGTEVGWFLWGITAEQLPVLIGAAAGGLVLVMTMLGLLIWRCCHQNSDNEKSYYLHHGSEDIEDKQTPRNVMQSYSESVVFLSSKQGNQAFRSCLVEKVSETDRVTSGITRSQSAPVKDDDQNSKLASPKRRPFSQPLQFNPSDASFAPPNNNTRGISHHLTNIHLPDIPEMALRSCEGLEQYSQYASSSVLDEVGDKMFHSDLSEAALKTRSLPAWVRARPRPLSTEDDLNELYAKVNFSKKRKNRMRNDSAAAIALNKSRSQFIQFPFMHKDTDSLVDNEAIVIYDERTAL